MEDDKKYLLALHTVEGLGPVRLKNLLEFFGSVKKAWEAKPAEWLKSRIPEHVLKNFSKTKANLDINKYHLKLASQNILTISWLDNNYPKLLKELYDPPFLLYCQGDLSLLSKKALAVVGTRKISSYGRFVTEKITHELASAGLVIVSGLARGVDTIAHQTTLSVQGKTIAVLGGGLNHVYPGENIALAKKIIQNGLIISESPPDSLPTAGSFPARNRIISGLSLGVVITEAAKDSGSLITARLALEQGREVFAVPGPITSSLSMGALLLIKDGASVVTSPADILEQIGIDQSLPKPQIVGQLAEIEKRLLVMLESEQKHIDELCRNLTKPVGEITAALIKMEIKGLVKNMGGGVYIKLA